MQTFCIGEARQGTFNRYDDLVSRGRSQHHMKTYSKPTLKKHASLKQVTFSSH